MTAEDPQDFGELATEIFTDLYAALESRVSQALTSYPDADRLAIATAISKAAWRGVPRGIAITTYAVNRKAYEEEAEDPDADVVRLNPQMRADPEPDFWAQRYGGDG